MLRAPARGPPVAQRGGVLTGILKRGCLKGEQDHYFLTKDEFYDVIDGRADDRLVRAKIAARRRDWDRNENKVANLPMSMRHGRAADLGGGEIPAGEGHCRGFRQAAGR